MKILFVLRSEGFFPYHQTTVDHLVTRGHHVTLQFANIVGPPDDQGFREWLSRGTNVSVEQAIRRRPGFSRRLLFTTREMRTYASYCRRGAEVKFYRDRWRRYLPVWLQGPAERGRLADAMFRSRLTDKLLAAVERAVPSSPEIVDLLRRGNYDCVIASPANLLANEEIEYVKAAKALNIPSIVPVVSWDNLTTKGLIQEPPDWVFAWHRAHATEAQSIHGIDASQIVVTGSPFFDKWFDTARPTTSRAVTCTRLGIDPAAPYLLYLGSSANIARDESWLVLALAEALRTSDDPRLHRLQLVFKPHPGGSARNIRALPRLVDAGIPVWPAERGRPDTTEAVDQFGDGLHHAAAVVGINTSGMIDAILCDRPCLALIVKRYRLTQSQTTHFRTMQASKALVVAKSVRQAVHSLGRILDGHDPTAAARFRFAATYVRPRGVGAQAGEAAAIAAELVAQRHSRDASAITSAIDRELGGRGAVARRALPVGAA
jgi:hypothetical protein